MPLGEQEPPISTRMPPPAQLRRAACQLCEPSATASTPRIGTSTAAASPRNGCSLGKMLTQQLLLSTVSALQLRTSGRELAAQP